MISSDNFQNIVKSARSDDSLDDVKERLTPIKYLAVCTSQDVHVMRADDGLSRKQLLVFGSEPTLYALSRVSKVVVVVVRPAGWNVVRRQLQPLELYDFVVGLGASMGKGREWKFGLAKLKLDRPNMSRFSSGRTSKFGGGFPQIFARFRVCVFAMRTFRRLYGYLVSLFLGLWMSILINRLCGKLIHHEQSSRV